MANVVDHRYINFPQSNSLGKGEAGIELGCWLLLAHDRSWMDDGPATHRAQAKLIQAKLGVIMVQQH